MYDLVHGTILLIAKRLFDASELKKDDEHQVFTPYAMKHFNTASGLSRRYGPFILSYFLKRFFAANYCCSSHGVQIKVDLVNFMLTCGDSISILNVN